MHFPFPARARLRLALVSACFLATCLSLPGGETLRLRADSWMPFNGEPGSDIPGYAIEIARTALEPHGVTIDYQLMPWGEALKAAAAGEIDAVIGANRDEAQGLIVPEEPIGLPRIALFVPKNSSWRYDNVPALSHSRLGVILDYKYWPTLDAYIEKAAASAVIKFSGDSPLEDAIAQLHAGQIDVVAETSSVFAWTAKAAGHPPGAFRIAYLHEGDPVFIAFANTPAGRRHAALLDDSIRELRRTGRLATLLTRYGQSDWTTGSAPRLARQN